MADEKRNKAYIVRPIFSLFAARSCTAAFVEKGLRVHDAIYQVFIYHIQRFNTFTAVGRQEYATQGKHL